MESFLKRGKPAKYLIIVKLNEMVDISSLPVAR